MDGLEKMAVTQTQTDDKWYPAAPSATAHPQLFFLARPRHNSPFSARFGGRNFGFGYSDPKRHVLILDFHSCSPLRLVARHHISDAVTDAQWLN
jgi:hypothetical protein